MMKYNKQIYMKYESLEIPWDDRWTIVQLYPQKTISEPQKGIEPTTFWWPVRRSNHQATKTQMESQGASSTHVRPKRKPLYINNDMDEIRWKIMKNNFFIRWKKKKMSLGSSMVGASHRSSEGCGFDPHLGLRNRFSEDRAWRSFIYHLIINKYRM